jgi:RHS repeat-associated protein
VDGWDLIEEYQPGSAKATAAYVYGGSDLIAGTHNGQVYYYYHDASGSTSHLADSTGHLVEWYRYDLQGTPSFYDQDNNQRNPNQTPYGVRHLFTGQQWYQELGLYDLRNRFYSPDLGRFLQPDPIDFGGDPTNLYRYCGNNPVMRSDRTGLSSGTVMLHVDGPGYSPLKERLAEQWEDVGSPDLMSRSTIGATPAAWVYGRDVNWAFLSEPMFGGNWNFAFGTPVLLPMVPQGRVIIGPLRAWFTTSDDTSDDPWAAQRAEELGIDESTDRSDMEPGDVYLTHYGYPGDPDWDWDTANWRGTYGQLDADSLAIGRDVARTYGLSPSGPVYINGLYIGNYMDRAPLGTIDIFDPYFTLHTSPGWGGNWGGILRAGTFTISSQPPRG